MRNLLRMRFFRWMHSRLVWAAALAVFVIGMMNAVTVYREIHVGEIGFDGGYFFTLCMASLFVTAAITAVQTGTDRIDGTVRNALISGYTKAQIYLSHLIPALCFTLLAAALNLLPLLRCPEVLSRMPRREVIAAFFGMAAAYFSVTAITVCFTLLTGSRVAAVMLCAALTGGSAVLSEIIQEPLSQTYYINLPPPGGGGYDAETGEYWYGAVIQKNPEYFAPPERTRAVWLLAAMPAEPFLNTEEYFSTAQVINEKDEMAQFYGLIYMQEMREFPEEIMGLLMPAGVTAAILFTACGVFAFRKRDIN